VLFSVEQAKDQSIYYSHGFKSTEAKAFGGNHTFREDEIEKQVSFREHEKLKLPKNFKGSHTGVKSSGIVLDKWDYEDNKVYLKSVVVDALSSSSPILIEQVILGRLEKYIERNSVRQRDCYFPSSELTIEYITKSLGFRLEIWIRDKNTSGEQLPCRDGIIDGIDIFLESKILSLLLIQNDNDICRGLVDNMLILRSKIS
jgi:hypothetical protein